MAKKESGSGGSSLSTSTIHHTIIFRVAVEKILETSLSCLNKIEPKPFVRLIIN